MASVGLVIAGVFFSGLGSIIVAIPQVKMTLAKIDEITTPTYTKMKGLYETLVEQRKFAGWGILLIAIGTSLLIVAALL